VGFDEKFHEIDARAPDLAVPVCETTRPTDPLPLDLDAAALRR